MSITKHYTLPLHTPALPRASLEAAISWFERRVLPNADFLDGVTYAFVNSSYNDEGHNDGNVYFVRAVSLEDAVAFSRAERHKYRSFGSRESAEAARQELHAELLAVAAPVRHLDGQEFDVTSDVDPPAVWAPKWTAQAEIWREADFSEDGSYGHVDTEWGSAESYPFKNFDSPFATITRTGDALEVTFHG